MRIAKACLATLLGASLLTSTVSSAQEYKFKDPTEDQVLRGAVGATMREAMRTRCVDDPQYANETSCTTTQAISAAATAALQDAEDFCNTRGVPITGISGPLKWIINCLDYGGSAFVNWLDGVPHYYPTASSNEDIPMWVRRWCLDAEIRAAPNGQGLIVPALPLSPGGPVPSGMGKTYFWSTPVDLRTDNGPANGLYRIHRINIVTRTGGEENPYYGAWRVEGFQSENSGGKFHWATTLYPGTNQPWVYDTVNTPQVFYQNNNSHQPCPTDGGSGDFHFYDYNNQCVWYAARTISTPTGYAYPKEVYVPFTQVNNWLHTDNVNFMNCNFSREFIAALVNSMWEAAVAEDPTNPPVPTQPVTPEEVRHCNRPPTFKGVLVQDGGAYDECSGDTPAPPKVPVPDNQSPDPPNSGGGGGDSAPASWYDPPPTTSGSGVGIPDFEISMPDWWPNLPTFDFSGATCPVYTLDLSGFWSEPFTIDSHCNLIEQYRALLGLLMLAVWTFAAALIVMRA